MNANNNSSINKDFMEIRNLFDARNHELAEKAITFPEIKEEKRDVQKMTRIRKQNKRQNKICKLFSEIMSFMSMIAVGLIAMIIILKFTDFDFETYMGIIIIISMLLMVVFGSMHEYISDRIDKLYNSKR